MLYSEGKKNLFNSMTHYISKNPNFAGLTKAQCSPNSLCLDGGVPLRLNDVNVVSLREVQPVIEFSAAPSFAR